MIFALRVLCLAFISITLWLLAVSADPQSLWILPAILAILCFSFIGTVRDADLAEDKARASQKQAATSLAAEDE